VIVPVGFTGSLIPQTGGQIILETVPVELYLNPTRPTSSAIVKTIVDAFMDRVEFGTVSTQVIVLQLVESGLVDVDEAAVIGRDIGRRQAEMESLPSITLNSVSRTGSAVEFDVLGYMAPGMAMMFLMYVVSHGGRSFLQERSQGTLPRLYISPTSSAQVLGGKVLGIFLTGTAQMFILIGASAVLFQLDWGNPLAVIILVLASVSGAVGWGLLITALSKTPFQVSSVGSAMMLTFGILGGSFFEVSYMPSWFRLLRIITPNAWSIDGFTILSRGGGLMDITSSIAALLMMGAGLFIMAAYLLNRRGIGQG
jgi:ABC-2 type transport system permease protein